MAKRTPSQTKRGTKKDTTRSSRKTAASKNSLVASKSSKKQGFWSFSRKVLMLLWRNKRLFVPLALLAWGALFVVAGSTQILQYNSLRDLTTAVSEGLFDGLSGLVLRSVVLLLAVTGGGLTAAYSEGQQFAVVFIFLMLWLSVVWLLRHMMAGTKALWVRDALYNSGSPIIASFLLGLVGVVQLAPVMIAILILGAAKASGFMEGPLGIAAFGALALASVVLALYMLTTTLIAAIVATIPGTYPVAAYRSARQLVRGKRLFLLKRITAMTALMVVIILVVLAPFVVLDIVFEQVWLPFAVMLAQIVSVVVFVYGSTYIYLLYRDIIDA